MSSHAELLLARERLSVGRRFLVLRPRVVAAGALVNALCLSQAPLAGAHKLAVGALFGLVVLAFFAESAWLSKRALSERWLQTSLLSTSLALGLGAALSGALDSPLLPLLYAPAVVGFAAFGRMRPSARLLGLTLAMLAALAALGWRALPLHRSGMLLASSLTALALLALGVVSLVDAHARIAHELDRRRSQVLREAELRASSVELLGARVAHDVKNPLTAVRGLLQLVQRNASGRDQERLGVALTELDRSLEVLHGYLSWARPLRDLTLVELDARALLDDVAAVLSGRAEGQHVQLAVQGERCSLLADRQRLWDALLNLALNALDAMPDGGRLQLSLARDGQRLVLALSDTGAGMEPEALARLGQAFASEREGGTGLGVLLARSAVAQHGGELRFESEPGRGTRALISLPLQPGAT